MLRTLLICCALAAGSIALPAAAASSSPATVTVSPGANLDTAYHAVADGGTVYLAAGSYGDQTLTLDPSKTGAGGHVTIEPAPGVGPGSVVLNSLNLGQDQRQIASAQHLTIRNLTLTSTNTSIQTWSTTNDVELDNLNGHALQILAGSNITVRGGDYGKCLVTVNPATNCTSRMIGTNITIDGAAFHDVVHDFTLDPDNQQHTEGLFVRGCRSCTLTHSRFWHDTSFDVFLQNCCGLQSLANITIGDNWFAATGQGPTGDSWTGGSAVTADSVIPGLRVIHNSFCEGGRCGFAARDANWSGTGAVVADNYFVRGGNSCRTGIAYRANVYKSFNATFGTEKCDPSETRVSSFRYVADSTGPGFDLHETARSPGIGIASTCTGRTIDGVARTSPCDVGASTYGSSGPAVGTAGSVFGNAVQEPSSGAGAAAPANPHGSSSSTSSSGSTVAPPPAPAHLRVTSTSGASATLAWEPVSGAVGYRVYVAGTLHHSLPGNLFTGSASLGGLPCAAGPVQVQVAAYNAGGEGPRASVSVTCSSGG